MFYVLQLSQQFVNMIRTVWKGLLNVSGESVIVLQNMTWEMVKPFAEVSKTKFINKRGDCFTQRI